MREIFLHTEREKITIYDSISQNKHGLERDIIDEHQ